MMPTRNVTCTLTTSSVRMRAVSSRKSWSGSSQSNTCGLLLAEEPGRPRDQHRQDGRERDDLPEHARDVRGGVHLDHAEHQAADDGALHRAHTAEDDDGEGHQQEAVTG